MRKSLLLSILFCFVLFFHLSAVEQTSDGGYVVIGSTQSYTNGVTDFLVYKLDAAGTKEWRKNFGGENYDNGMFIQQTSDGGYICCGTTQSYVHGSTFYCDMLVYKLDASGTKEWRKNFGGNECDHAYTIRQTTDGGYILSGETYSYVHGPYHADSDFLVYKLDAAGTKLWRKNFGGDLNEYDSDIIQTSDGGYALLGSTYSYSNGDVDFLVYRLDAAGNKLWRKNFGGEQMDHGMVLQQTSDGGFILAGYGDSYTNGSTDFLVYRINAAGSKLWRKNFGGTSWDEALGIMQTSDGGYIVGGQTGSYGTDGDFLAYRLDASGTKLWRKNFGGEEDDWGTYIVQTSDGGFFFFGDGDSYVHGGGKDYGDFLAYKLNASGAKEWRKNYGGEESEFTGRGPR